MRPGYCGSFTLVFILIVSSPQLWTQIHWEARLLHLPLWQLGLGLWPSSLNHWESKYRRSFYQITSVASPSCSVEAQPKGFSFPRALFYLQKHGIVFGLTSGLPATLVLTLTWVVLVHMCNPNTSEERQKDCSGLEASLGLQFQASLGSRVRSYLKQ